MSTANERYNRMEKITVVAIVSVLGLLGLWVGFRLIEALVPLMVKTVLDLSGFIGWCITIALIICIAIFVITVPLVTFIGILLAFNFMIQELKKIISGQERDAAIDAYFLVGLALRASLVGYMGTEDFLHPFLGKEFKPSGNLSKGIRILAVVAAGCSMTKALFLIPVHSVKVIAMVLTIVVLGGDTSIVLDSYLAKGGLSFPWNGIRHLPLTIIFVAMTSCLLTLIALAYPFSPSGWKRVWHIEPSKPV